MKGRFPKPPQTRQRRNRTSTRATLPPEGAAPARKAPALPRGKWRAETRQWWKNVWASPMAGEYLTADVDGLLILAQLIDAFWSAPSSSLAGEIRLQRQCFGLTPVDRHRLQWEMERAAATKKRTPGAAAPPSKGVQDPRRVLRRVK